MNILLQEGHLKEIKSKWYFPQSSSPAHHISLRTLGEDQYDLIIQSSPHKNLGQLDSFHFDRQVFPEGIYLAGGKTYRIMGMAPQLKQVLLEESESDFFTVPIISNALEWRESLEAKGLGGGRAKYGLVRQTSRVEKLKRVQFYTGRNRGFLPAERELPPLETTAVIFTPSTQRWSQCGEKGLDPLAGLLGLCNLLQETIPLSTSIDKGDVQVLMEPDAGNGPGLAVLDIYPGGIGLAQKAFETAEDIFGFAGEVLDACGCTSGCPGCVGYEATDLPGNQDLYPSKAAARFLLREFLK